MKGVQDAGSIPAGSTKSILGSGHARDNAKRLLAVNVPVKKTTNMLLMGSTRFRLGNK